MNQRLVFAAALASTAIVLSACAGSSTGTTSTRPTGSDAPATVSATASPGPTAATGTASPVPLDSYLATLKHGPRDLATPITLQPIRDITSIAEGADDRDLCPGPRGTTAPDYVHVSCVRLDEPVLTIRRILDVQATPGARPSEIVASPSDRAGWVRLTLTLTAADRAVLAKAAGQTRLARLGVVTHHTAYWLLRTRHPQDGSGRILLTLRAQGAHEFVAALTE